MERRRIRLRSVVLGAGCLCCLLFSMMCRGWAERRVHRLGSRSHRLLRILLRRRRRPRRRLRCRRRRQMTRYCLPILQQKNINFN